MRVPLRIAEAIRQEIPATHPVFVRISAVAGIDVGWYIDDSVVLVKQLASIGIDAIACSSGGIRLRTGQNLVSWNPGFQVPIAVPLKKETGIARKSKRQN